MTDPAADVVSQVKCSVAAEVVRTHGRLRLRVTGLSMLPAVWPGDIVTVEAREPSRLAPGELVLVEDAGRLRLHRLIASQASGAEILLVTRGDSLSYDDPPVRAEQVLGVVTSIRRGAACVAPSNRRSRLACLFSNRSVTLAALRMRSLFAGKETLGNVS